MRAESKTPDVILDAAKFGILASAKDPLVTLPVPIANTGMRAESKTPDVIFEVAKFGISAASRLILALLIVPVNNDAGTAVTSISISPVPSKFTPVAVTPVTSIFLAVARAVAFAAKLADAC